eukprot:gene737-biopygen615
MLCNRWTMLELRAQLELDPSSSHRGGAEALRAKLQFVEDRVYQAADGVVADEVLQQWLNDFDKSRGKAMLNTTVKQAANTEAESVLEEKAKVDGAASPRPMSDVLGTGPPPAFDHGGTLRDASLQQQVAGRGEAQTVGKQHMVEGDEEISCFSRVPGAQTGRQRVAKLYDGFWTVQQYDNDGCMVGLGVVVETASDEQVERSKDLEDIELLARYIRSEANVWADNLSRCEDLDNWRLNRDWFVWANKQWGPYTVDRFASQISAQLPRYCAAWRDARCEGQSWFRELEALTTGVVIMPRRRDLFTRSRLGGSELQGPSTWDAMMFFIQASPCAAQLKSSFATAPTPEVTVGTRLEVFWEDDAKFYPGVVKSFNEDGAAHVVYDDGDEETLNLSEEKFNILLGNGASEQNSERGGGYEKNKRGGDTQNFFVCSLCGRSKDELGQSDITDLPILMQPRSLLDSTLNWTRVHLCLVYTCSAMTRHFLWFSFGRKAADIT